MEPALGLEKGSLRFEMMIETTQAILNERGESSLPLFLDASAGRCIAAHFGTYDYTASCSITAAYQAMDHPACDFAKNMMQVAFAGTGIWLSDGATNVLPAPPHRAEKGKRLTRAQQKENREAVHRAWRLHYGHIQHSLITAYYQGWDLHPAQLPTRYAAVFSFFLEGLDSAAARLKNFVEKAAKATLVGDVFDDAATGQGLLNYFPARDQLRRDQRSGSGTPDRSDSRGITFRIVPENSEKSHEVGFRSAGGFALTSENLPADAGATAPSPYVRRFQKFLVKSSDRASTASICRISKWADQKRHVVMRSGSRTSKTIGISE